MRASIRRASDAPGGGLDWFGEREVDFVATATTPHQDAPAHQRLLAAAISRAEEWAVAEPGALFGVFMNAGADGAVSYAVTSEEPEHIACSGFPLLEAA